MTDNWLEDELYKTSLVAMRLGIRSVNDEHFDERHVAAPRT